MTDEPEVVEDVPAHERVELAEVEDGVHTIPIVEGQSLEDAWVEACALRPPADDVPREWVNVLIENGRVVPSGMPTVQ